MLISQNLQKTIESKNVDISQFFHFLDYKTFPRYPTEKYVHLVLNIELNDFAIFTQDGLGLLIAETFANEEESENKISRGCGFQRKIRAALRRKFMSILRTYSSDIMQLNKGKITEIKGINRLTPDASIFGFAVSEKDSDDNIAFSGKSRLLTDSVWTIRNLSKEIADYITFNAQSDKIRIDEPSTALGEKEYYFPETSFPCILTLRDPTIEDLQILTYTIQNLHRFGATSSVSGKSKIYLCGAYLTNAEILSNLELSKKLYSKLDCKEKIPPSSILNQMILDTINESCLKERIETVFLNYEELNSIYLDIYQDHKSIETWIREYSYKYFEILLLNDTQNKFQKNDGFKKRLTEITTMLDNSNEDLHSFIQNTLNIIDSLDEKSTSKKNTKTVKSKGLDSFSDNDTEAEKPKSIKK